MTPNQIKALDYLRDCITRGGFSPKLAEIGAHVGVSKTSAHELVIALEARGYVRRIPTKARGIELADAPDLRAIDSALMKAELARRGEIAGAFSRPVRRVSRGGATCAAECCQTEVPFGHAFCREHWWAIGDATRSELLRAHRAARASRSDEDAAWYQDVFGRALDEATRFGRRN